MISFIFPVTAIRCAQAATENVQQQSNSTGNAQESSSIGNAQQSGNTRPSENSINSESMENNAISNSEKSSLSESCGGLRYLTVTTGSRFARETLEWKTRGQPLLSKYRL